MLDAILTAVNGDLVKFSNILLSAQQLVTRIESHIPVDGSIKDEAIEAIIKLLQSKKSSGTS